MILGPDLPHSLQPLPLGVSPGLDFFNLFYLTHDSLDYLELVLPLPRVHQVVADTIDVGETYIDRFLLNRLRRTKASFPSVMNRTHLLIKPGKILI